ncbi:MAG: stage III sporulation protein AB [Clostridia bacterium]|nr:stage III sporulation protein AB [Clostridia bacterium]
MKLAGAFLIFAFSVAVGIILGERKKNASRECAAFLELFRYVRGQISCFDTPTKLIWRGFENDVLEKSGFLKALSEAEDGEIYFDAFSRAFKASSPSFSMSADAKEIVASFGGVIGKSPSGEQLSAIDMLISQMAEASEKAKAEADRDGKLCLTLGFAVGAAIFIMLL